MRSFALLGFTGLVFVLLMACAGAETPVTAPIAGNDHQGVAMPNPEPVALSDATEVDATCTVDADCAVKNVGNCCGYAPACVNKDSPTFPERVKAQCASNDMASICGFQEPAGCACVDGQCASTGPSAGGGELK